MKLLGNRFAPTTFCIGFLESPFDIVCDADRQWRTSIGQYSFHDRSGNLASLLSILEPLSGPLTRYVWIATRGDWTAYFDNFVNGSDPFGPISHLSQRIGCRGLLLSCHPNIPKKSYGQTRFDLYGQKPTDSLNFTRTVAATNDGGRWSWDTSGEPLAFENTAAYDQRRITNRLTPTMVDDYARALGVDAFNDAYYGDRGCLVTNENVDPSRCRTETFEDVQNNRGIPVDA